MKMLVKRTKLKLLKKIHLFVKSPDKEFLSDEKGEIINLENDNLIVDFNSKGVDN